MTKQPAREELNVASIGGDTYDPAIGFWRIQLGAGIISSLVGIGLLAAFVIQNTQGIEVRFLVLSFTWPLWLLIVVSALSGALVWFGVGVVRRHRRWRARRQERRG